MDATLLIHSAWHAYVLLSAKLATIASYVPLESIPLARQLKNTHRILSAMNEFDVLEFTWKAVIALQVVIGIAQLVISAPYGRYTRGGYGFPVNVRVAWVLQECPSFLIPVFVAGYLGGDKITGALNPNVVLLSMFLLHYFQRYTTSYFAFLYDFNLSSTEHLFIPF